jgi:hypothetical protein
MQNATLQNLLTVHGHPVTQQVVCAGRVCVLWLAM